MLGDPATPAAKQICLDAGSFYDVAQGQSVSPTWVSNSVAGPTGFGGAANSPALKAGATWDSLWSGNANGSYNSVRPRFTNAALQDQFRPSDKFLINASIRYDNFTYDLPESASNATQFYANMTANYTCVQAATNLVFTTPLGPGAVPPAPAQYVVGDCNQGVSALTKTTAKGWVHPNGTVQDGVQAPNFTASSPSSYALNYWQPRFSATFTQSPDVVWRLSAGRFTQPPISASVQYLALAGDDRSVWNNTMNLGFYSPFHPIPGISSGQYDLSYEQHFRGTDMSFKLTPFYTWVSDWQQQTFIGAGFVTQVPVGVNRNEGAEFQFNKGDFTRNGLSGIFALTYTSSKVLFQDIPLQTGGTIPNATNVLNQAITAWNGLTKAGGGFPCYQGGVGVSCSKPNSPSGVDTILNPYYNMAPQGLLSPGAWYNPYSTAIAPNLNGAVNSYISPWVSSLILNWRHDKLAITPSFNFQTGGFYGSPLDTMGLDPRTCTQNSAATGITKLSPKTNPLQCNYLTTTRSRSGRVRLPLHPQSADRFVPLRQLSAAQLDRRKPPAFLRREPADSADGAGNQPLPHLLRRNGSRLDRGRATQQRRLRLRPGRWIAQQHALSEQLLQRHEHQRLQSQWCPHAIPGELHAKRPEQRSDRGRSTADQRLLQRANQNLRISVSRSVDNASGALWAPLLTSLGKAPARNSKIFHHAEVHSPRLLRPGVRRFAAARGSVGRDRGDTGGDAAPGNLPRRHERALRSNPRARPARRCDDFGERSEDRQESAALQKVRARQRSRHRTRRSRNLEPARRRPAIRCTTKRPRPAWRCNRCPTS